jgi:trans-aconitate methyltransferase
MSDSQWQTEQLSKTYLEGVRAAIPLAETQLEVILKLVRAWCPGPRGVIDLGCGDGILGRSILRNFPGSRVWFVDFSDTMLAAAREEVGTNERATVVKADFSAPAWSKSFQARQDIDLVVSGFAIHHQPDRRKRELYAEIFELLAPGGLFLNLEHVASASEEIQAVFDEFFIDHLHAHHCQSEPDKRRAEIAETYYTRPDKVENILAMVETQCAWLRRIGYKDVDCFFKILELALFGGRKPLHG